MECHVLCNLGRITYWGGGGGGGLGKKDPVNELFHFLFAAALHVENARAAQWGVNILDPLSLGARIRIIHNLDLFRLCPPPESYAPPVTEHVTLHGNSLFKNKARESGGANTMQPLIWGAQTKKILQFLCLAMLIELQIQFFCSNNS